MTWVRFLGWLDLGMLIYWFYGRTHRTLADRAEAARRTAAESFANFVLVLGALVTFNGFAIALLGFLTTLGVTTEELAKWSEVDELISKIGLHISADIADRFGLVILGIGIVLLVIGILLRKSVAKPSVPAGRG
jgi:hypothetical protein